MSNTTKEIDGKTYVWALNAGKEYFRNLSVLRNRVIDEPFPTKKHNLEELKKMGIVGLWEIKGK